VKVLVTGGAGFIGSHLVKALLDKGYEVAVVDDLSNGDEKSIDKRAKLYTTDIVIFKHIAEVFSDFKPEVVFHLAAHKDVRESVSCPYYDAQINVLGSVNVFQLCVNHQVQKVIFSSTCAVYGNPDKIPVSELTPTKPLSPYGLFKLTGEQLLYYYFRTDKLKSVTLRYANVYGPGQNSGIIGIVVDSVKNGKTVSVFGDGSQIRDYVYIDDVVKANLLSLDTDKGGVFNIGSGKGTSVNEIIETVNSVSKRKVDVVYKEKQLGDPDKIVLDISLANKILGYEPSISLEEGIKRCADAKR